MRGSINTHASPHCPSLHTCIQAPSLLCPLPTHPHPPLRPPASPGSGPSHSLSGFCPLHAAGPCCRSSFLPAPPCLPAWTLNGWRLSQAQAVGSHRWGALLLLPLRPACCRDVCCAGLLASCSNPCCRRHRPACQPGASTRWGASMAPQNDDDDPVRRLKAAWTTLPRPGMMPALAKELCGRSAVPCTRLQGPAMLWVRLWRHAVAPSRSKPGAPAGAPYRNALTEQRADCWRQDTYA